MQFSACGARAWLGCLSVGEMPQLSCWPPVAAPKGTGSLAGTAVFTSPAGRSQQQGFAKGMLLGQLNQAPGLH